MREYREKLIDRMVALYGYEHEITIGFARMCEQLGDSDWNDTTLRLLVESHEADPYVGEQDD